MDDYDFKLQADIRDWVNGLFLNHEYYKDAEVTINELQKLGGLEKYYTVSIIKDGVYHYTKNFYI